MKRLIVGLAFVAAASVGYADSARTWEYDADTQILTDGAWTLMAKDLGNQTLQVGVGKDDRTDGRTDEPWAFPAEIGASSAGRLDLTGAVYTKGKTNDESARWTITEIMDGAFSAADDCVTAFVAPTTITNFGMRVFRYNTGLTDVVFNCPELTGTLCIWGLEFTGSAIPRLVLDIPQVTAIGGNSANFNKATLDETYLSTWDLSSVKTLGKGALAASANKSRSGGPTGDLDLPNVETIGDGAFDCWTRVSSVAFGTNGTLKTLGKTLFWNQGAKDGLAAGPTKIDFGKSWDFSVDAQAFYAELPRKVSAWPNGMPLPLEEIWFASKAPSVETLDRILVLQEPGANGEKPVKIYAPTADATWQAICLPFTDDETAAAQATGEAVVGVYARVDGARVAWIVKRPFASVAATTRASNETGGTVTITVGGAPIESGTELRLGTEVTVTATPAKETTQVSWEGTLSDGTTPTGRSFTFTVSGPVSFHAVFSPAWEYDADVATISDGYWTLKAEQVDAVAQTLKIPTTTNTLDATRTGELNLMGPVYAKGAVGEESQRWTIVETVYGAFKGVKSNISSFYAPTTLTAFGGHAFDGVYTLENVVLKCPNLTAELGLYGYAFGNSGLARLVLDLPKLTVVGRDGPNFTNATFSETDLSEWNLTNLKTIHDNGFASRKNVGPQGVLDLPNVETIGNTAFNGWTRQTAAALGTNGTLKTLGSTIFANNTTALKKLDFGTSATFTVESDTFLAADDTPLPVEEIWFAGEAPSVEVLDALLALRTVGDDGTKPVKIYAPMMKDSWQGVCTAFVGDERTAARAIRKQTGHRVVGVYETSDGRRAAWLVQNPNFPYSSGLMFLIR